MKNMSRVGSRGGLWLAQATVIACGKGAATAPGPPAKPALATSTFTNPLLPSGAGPRVVQKDSFYYYTSTGNNELRVWKTAKMSNLSLANYTVAWRPPTTGPALSNLWAPELYSCDGKWYLCYSAGPAANDLGNQRTWVLENARADPTPGTWTDKGQIATPGTNLGQIDGTVLKQNGNRYFICSGFNGTDGIRQLYLSRMSNPWALTGPRVEPSPPEHAWEKAGPPYVNAEPEILQRAGQTFLVYSASFCGTGNYSLGLLSTATTADPMLPAARKKLATPVFFQSPANRAYAPGHNSFFVSKDGSENWLVHYANTNPGEGGGEKRTPRMQKFTRNADGTPNFGTPVAINTALAVPGGSKSSIE